MDFYNLSDFLCGQSSKIITKLSANDKAALAVVMSVQRYERLMKTGIDITEY